MEVMPELGTKLVSNLILYQYIAQDTVLLWTCQRLTTSQVEMRAVCLGTCHQHACVQLASNASGLACVAMADSCLPAFQHLHTSTNPWQVSVWLHCALTNPEKHSSSCYVMSMAVLESLQSMSSFLLYTLLQQGISTANKGQCELSSSCAWQGQC